MKKELLLLSAQELSTEDAGGHGNRWGVFNEDVSAFMSQWLGVAVSQSEVSAFGMTDNVGLEQLEQVEPAVVGLLYTGQEVGACASGLMSLIHQDPGGPDQEPSNVLWSAFPFFGDGVEVLAEVEQVNLHPNRIEACLQLGLNGGGLICAFDTCFWQSRAVYRADECYRFVVSALAYEMQPASALDHVIDDEDEIRRFRARNAWAEIHGQWTKADEEASLAAWQPKSPAELEPIRVSMGQMAALMASSEGPADDADFVGEVMQVTPRAVRMLDVDFWRVDTVVIRADEDLVLPIYVAEHVFEGDWRPEVGQYVCGSLWLQAYALGRAETE